MQIKNILLATLFVATSQVFCADEQTDVKAKLRTELEVRGKDMENTLSDLSKKVIAQEVSHNTIMKELDEKFDKYIAWQIYTKTKNDTNFTAIEQKINIVKESCRLEYNNFVKIIADALNKNIKIENLSFNEEYKISNEIDHDLLRFYYVRSFIETIKLKVLVGQWEKYINEINDFRQQLLALQ